MASTKKNKQLFLDQETLATLAIAKEGVLGKVDKLMNLKEAREVNETGYYKGSPMPFSNILSPKGKRNQEIIKNIKNGEIVDIIVNGEKSGEIIAEESFKIDRVKRITNIFGFYDESNPRIKMVLNNLGEYAISGKYDVTFNRCATEKLRIQKAIKEQNAKKITGIMMGANPLNRAHERLIRTVMDRTDLIIVFLTKPFKKVGFTYELRKEVLEYYIQRYLPQNKIIIVPFENTYVFAGQHNLLLQSIVASNFGCTNLAIGYNHSGTGMHFNKNQLRLSLDEYNGDIDINLDIYSEYVFCDQCKTLVSQSTCPHGSHHHIKYHDESLKQLLLAGFMPPSILIRQDISSRLLIKLHPNRLKGLQDLCINLFPNKGLIEARSERDFYEDLMKLYQTTSMV